MEHKIKLAILVPTLRFGGGERVASNLINELSLYKDLDIKVILYDKRQVDYGISKDVDILSIDEETDINGFLKKTFSFFRKAKKVRKTLKDNDIQIALSIMPSMNIFVLLGKYNTLKTIVTIHNIIRDRKLSLSGIMLKLQKIFYAKSDEIVAVSNGVRKSVLNNIDKDLQIDVIYNPLDSNHIKKLSLESIEFDFDYILGVGRLTKQKGFDILIKAFNELKDKSLHLVLLGDGDEKDYLLSLVKDFGLEDRVHFVGFVNNPYKYMRNSKCFVLSSRWEGFGLVLAEALISNAKVVSFDCEAGPNEIIENKDIGTLVYEIEDYIALSKGIEKELDLKRDINTIENSMKRFNINNITQKYYKLIKDLTV